MHRGGFSTILQANGSLFTGVDLDGPAFVQLAGGDLSEDEDLFVDAIDGKVLPDGSLIDWFPKRNVGTFTFKIRVPFSRHPILGSGVYLPKSQRAWGYFNGSNTGGRLDLSLDGGEFPPE